MPFTRPIPESKLPKKASSGLGAYVEAEKLIQIAFVLPSAAFIGWAVGWWADQRLHQSWIAIVGIIFGCIAGLVSVIRMALVAERNSRPGNEVENGTGKGSPNLKP
ncbi:MAG: AtpZ/AtpI family protein [Terracidiphilus sp.]|jgi:F0F1-type ATP synthase assembly protein I